jgi:ubiquinone/menaquinone biosynthesis C-methylase UbiE/broad specificity phosphatase PhoE
MQNRYSELLQNAESAADSGLTARGWEQANQLAQWLASHEAIDALYAAPLLRSRLTAQRIGQALNLPVTVHEGLPGRFTPGMTIPHAWERNARSLDQAGPTVAVDPASPYGEYVRRLVGALDAIVAENWGKTVAVVLSGNGVATAIRHFTGAHVLAVAVNHTALSELRRQDNAWYLVVVNRREHLPVPPLLGQRPRGEAPQPPSGGELSQEATKVAATYNRLVFGPGTRSDPPRVERLRHFLRFAQLPPNQAVLDVGTGVGELTLLLAEEGAREVVGVDVSPNMLEAAEYLRLRSMSPVSRRVSFRLAPAHQMPFRDERFDAVFLRLVLHHTRQPQALLAEAVRVLRHDGLLIVADLISVGDPVKRATQNAIEERRNPSHVAARSSEQYQKLITGAGLVIEAEQTATFERELDEWLNDMQADPVSRTIVREMMEAGLETDAAGLNARRQGNRLVFDQRLFYLKARKP